MPAGSFNPRYFMPDHLTDRFFQKGRDFLGVRFPFIAGAMTWVSDPKLVAAVCNAGGFACLAGGNSPAAVLEKQIQETRSLTDKPFGVNLITIAPEYPRHLELVERLRLPFVIFAGSFPRHREVLKAKETGARVLCFASELSIAERMIGYGADGLILEGSEAGGHVGYVSLVVLLQQVLFHVTEVPVFAGGGIATGRMAAHVLLMGAAGVQMGTRFAVAEESAAHPRFKERFLKAKAREAVSTPQYDSRLHVVAVRAIKNKAHEAFGRLQLDLIRQIDEGRIGSQEAQFKVEEFWVGALRRAVVEGDVDAGSLMAGQSVGLVNRTQSVQALMDELVRETGDELERVKRSLA
jgi:enoyl-[acyl-carrier protein] reductase II